MDEIQIHRLHEEKLPMDTVTGFAPLFTWRGRDVYPVFGAEGEEGGADDQDSESGGDDDSDTGDGKADSSSGGVTREEFDQLRKQLSASDKRRDEAEKRLKELDDAKKDELTKATERADAAEKLVQQRDKDIAELRLQNAFLTANTGITWHDPTDALGIAERQGYLDEVVGEGGKVDASKLSAKLKELAKAKPHLVKTGGEAKEDKEAKPPTGQKVGSKGNGGTKTGDDIPSRYSKFLNR